MAQTYSNELSGLFGPQPIVKPSAGSGYGAHLKRYRATVPLKSQTLGAGNEVVLALLPPGSTFSFGVITSDTSLGTSTVSVGVASAATKYKAAAVLTTTDLPAIFGLTSAITQSATLAEEQVLLQVLVGNLPASGTLVVDLYVSSAN